MSIISYDEAAKTIIDGVNEKMISYDMRNKSEEKTKREYVRAAKLAIAGRVTVCGFPLTYKNGYISLNQGTIFKIPDDIINPKLSIIETEECQRWQIDKNYIENSIRNFKKWINTTKITTDRVPSDLLKCYATFGKTLKSDWFDGRNEQNQNAVLKTIYDNASGEIEYYYKNLIFDKDFNELTGNRLFKEYIKDREKYLTWYKELACVIINNMNRQVLIKYADGEGLFFGRTVLKFQYKGVKKLDTFEEDNLSELIYKISKTADELIEQVEKETYFLRSDLLVREIIDFIHSACRKKHLSDINAPNIIKDYLAGKLVLNGLVVKDICYKDVNVKEIAYILSELYRHGILIKDKQIYGHKTERYIMSDSQYKKCFKINSKINKDSTDEHRQLQQRFDKGGEITDIEAEKIFALYKMRSEKNEKLMQLSRCEHFWIKHSLEVKEFLERD